MNYQSAIALNLKAGGAIKGNSVKTLERYSCKAAEIEAHRMHREEWKKELPYLIAKYRC